MLPGPVLRAFLRANAVLRRSVYSSRRSTRVALGLDLLPCASISYFELGSVAMIAALRRELRPGMRVVDVGTGPYAVVALWAARRRGVHVVATEIDEPWAEWARAMARRNGLSLDVRCCDLITAVPGPLDLVWFVPPFTSEETFRAQIEVARITDPAEIARLHLRSCGGELGWELIDRLYAQLPGRLAPQGRVLVVVNEGHVDPDRIVSLAAERGLRATRWRPVPVLPYSVVGAERRT